MAGGKWGVRVQVRRVEVEEGVDTHVGGVELGFDGVWVKGELEVKTSEYVFEVV